MPAASPISLELYLDHACPWSYMAFSATREVAEQKGLLARWRLLPIAGTVGLSRADSAMHAQRFAAAWPMALTTARNDFGLSLRRPGAGANGVPAAELVGWLRQEMPARESDLHAALFEAQFVLGHDIADPALLRQLAGRLLGREVPPEIASGKASSTPDSLLEDRRAARAAGVTAVPTIVLAGSHLVLGAEPAPVLAQAIEQLTLLSQLGPIAEIG